MANTITNDAKREQMKAIMAELLGTKGWTRTEIALAMFVTSSCVSSWSTGKSMGTNAQRAELAGFPARNEGGKAMLEECLDSAKRSLANREGEIVKTKAELMDKNPVNGIVTTRTPFNYSWCKGVHVVETNVETGLERSFTEDGVYLEGNAWGHKAGDKYDTGCSSTSNVYAWAQKSIKTHSKRIKDLTKALGAINDREQGRSGS